jgi:ABC-type antimicrobial peptide transport system permease subunit
MEVMSVVDRSQLADHARLSPVVRSAKELLAIAVLVAVLLALLGIVLAVSSDVRARRWEILDLSAQGLDRRSIVRFARARLLLACGFAGLLALGLGLALVGITVRLIRIAADIETANPPPLVAVNWPALGIGAVVVTVAAVALVNVVTGAQLRRLEGSRT